MPEFRIPLATYRIQFSLAFRFVDGRDLVPYLHELGITDLYSSPHFRARRGSPHAYDIANPLKINSELGTEEEFREMSQKLKNYGMGLVLDIVPNHMATSSENPWWMDLLENGRNSIYANHFAVDWGRANAKAWGRPRILLPVLGDLYGKVLENGEISLKLDENGFYAKYFETRLPLDPKSYALLLEPCRDGLRERGSDDAAGRIEQLLAVIASLPAPAANDEQRRERHQAQQRLKADLWQAYQALPDFKAQLDECLIAASGIKGDPKSFDRLDRILDCQHYRIAFWRLAAEELNYRRFFDITDLIGVRIEDPEVFEARHQEVLRLVHEGTVTGLRVDHIDGLWDPAGYLERLRARALENGAGEAGFAGYYVIVEKILAGDEQLPRDWRACGTTGYDFLNWLNGVFVDPQGLRRLDEAYRKFSGLEMSMAEVQYSRKKLAMDTLFPGEVRALGYHLGRLAAQDRLARDLSFGDLVHGLVEVIAWLPVYRTYTRGFEVSERDRAYIEQAIGAAARALPALDPEVFAFLRRVLLLEVPHYAEARGAWLGFVMGWQQFTGPCMAKGFEDTTYYVYNRLISQNEVGSDPELADDPVDVEGFHQRNRERLANLPYSLNATSTHDTKRSEDVRARINVLSEIPEIWEQRIERWSRCNARHKTQVDGRAAPDRNDEWMLYQTLAGAWPLCEEDVAGFRDRLKTFAQKALREAKVHTSWLAPNDAYENACLAFIDGILEDEKGFLRDFLEFQRQVMRAGLTNALSQALLKICAPGVPDFYQGSELWDLSLVDPDNRRPVDFRKRGAFLDELRKAETHDVAGLLRELTSNWEDGRIKLYLTYKALNFRRAHPELFLHGDYIPVTGSAHACAFARRQGEEWALAAVPRLTLRLGQPPQWGGEALALPAAAPARWRNVFTCETLEARDEVRLANLFAAFPVALLEPAS